MKLCLSEDRPRGLVALLAIVVVVAVASGCVSRGNVSVDPLIDARRAGADSKDGEVVGTWLLTELAAPGGSLEQARAARARLDGVAKNDHGVYASIARG